MKKRMKLRLVRTFIEEIEVPSWVYKRQMLTGRGLEAYLDETASWPSSIDSEELPIRAEVVDEQ